MFSFFNVMCWQEPAELGGESQLPWGGLILLTRGVKVCDVTETQHRARTEAEDQ